MNVHWKDWCWRWSSNTLATCKELTHWKRPWCLEILKAGGEGDDRGWDDWMASSMQRAWVWVGSGSWWWTGKPGVLQSVGSDTTEPLNWTDDNTFTGDLKQAHWVPADQTPFTMHQSVWLLVVSCSVVSFFDPMDCSTTGFPVLRHLPELAQTHVRWVGDAIQPSHHLSSPSPPAFNISQHQSVF